MKIIKCSIIACALLLAATCLGQTPPVPAPVVAPGQVADILAHSVDLAEVAAALKTAVEKPELRPLAVAYLDGPSRYNQMLAKLQADHGEEYAKDIFGTISRYWGPSLDNLYKIFVHGQTPEIFTMFEHYAESEFAFSIPGSRLCESLARDLPPGSPLRPLLLDYLTHAINDLCYVEYLSADNHHTFVGVFNALTGKYDSRWLTPEEEAAAKSGKERRDLFLGGQGLRYMLLLNSDDAYAQIAQIVAANTYSQEDVSNLFSDGLNWNRYDPRAIRIYEVALLAAPFDKKTMPFDEKLIIIDAFLNIQPGPADAPLPRQLDQADPAVYADILAFIAEAESIKYTDAQLAANNTDRYEYSQLVDGAKKKVLALYAQHHLTPPTDAEITKLVDEATKLSIPPPASAATSAPSKSSAPASASASAKPAVQPVEASPLPLYVVGGTIAVLVAALYLFRRK
ncbi:MAG TPA: hypothetical protein VK737_12940 [Opitutales bacterium]|nr:hypothetical protein [Opitutales bacterium]